MNLGMWKTRKKEVAAETTEYPLGTNVRVERLPKRVTGGVSTSPAEKALSSPSTRRCLLLVVLVPLELKVTLAVKVSSCLVS